MRRIKSLFGLYISLTKPGIIFGNLITATAGFFFASKGHINVSLLIFLIIGTAFGIASGCVFNNYIDRGIDSLMERTKNRAVVRKTISGRNALLFGTILGAIGFPILVWYVNLLTALIGLIGFFFYVVMYSIWKRRSVHGTLVGSISGATPPVAGYCAVTNHIDLAALLLFIFLVIWQMPHFYAIAIYRFKDYASAKIPVLPVKKGIYAAKIYIVCYIVLSLVVTSLFTLFHYSGYVFFIVMELVGLRWLVLACQGFYTKDDVLWAKKIFTFSLVVLLFLSCMLAISWVLP